LFVLFLIKIFRFLLKKHILIAKKSCGSSWRYHNSSVGPVQLLVFFLLLVLQSLISAKSF